MATQPVYHRAVVLFTTKGTAVSLSDFEKSLRQALAKSDSAKTLAIVTDSIVCEEIDNEEGDPADL